MEEDDYCYWEQMKDLSYCSFNPTYKPNIIYNFRDSVLIHKINFCMKVTFTDLGQYSTTVFRTGEKTLLNWDLRIFTIRNTTHLSLALRFLSSSSPSKPVDLIIWSEDNIPVIEETFLLGEIRILSAVFKYCKGVEKLIKLEIRLHEHVEISINVFKHAENIFSNDYDVCLWGNEWKYKAHRQILSEASPVFAAMFQHDMTESSDGEVNIKDADGPSILALLTYIYTGRIYPNTNIYDLYKLADKYQMEDLKSACLGQPITISNVLTILNLCQVYDLVDFKRKCLVFIEMNLEEVSKKEEWGRLQQQSSILSSIVQQLSGLSI